MPSNRLVPIFVTLAIAVASPAYAQTGTPTISPAGQASVPEVFQPSAADLTKKLVTLDADLKRTAAETEQELEPAVQRLLEDEVKRQAGVSTTPRIIAEFGKRSAGALGDLQARARTSVATEGTAVQVSKDCVDARSVASDFSGAALALSIADRESPWRIAVRRVQSAADRLATAARTARRSPCVKLDKYQMEEAQNIEASMLARIVVLQAILDLGFQPAFSQSDDAVSLLTALSVSQTDGTKQLALSPFDYFFSNHWRLYVRSTVVVDEEEAEEDAGPSNGSAATEAPAPEDLADSVKLALLDPFGGPLNVSGGYYAKILTPFLKGDANDLHHGLFLDVRAGLKFVDLPEQKLKLVKGKTRNTPFYQAAAGLRLLLPIFKGAPGSDKPGGVELAMTGSWNRVADIGASALFSSDDGAPALLDRDIRNVHLAIKIDLPDPATSIQIAGTVWSSSKFDRRFQIGFGINRNMEKKGPTLPKPPAEPQAEKNE